MSEHSVIFDPDDLFVIVTPQGEEVHVPRMLALVIQYALFTGGDVVSIESRWDLLRWLDDHAIRPSLAHDQDDTVVLLQSEMTPS